MSDPYPEIYKIREGDTFESLAQFFYGDSALSPRLYQANPDMQEGALPIGRYMVIPSDPTVSRLRTASPVSPIKASNSEELTLKIKGISLSPTKATLTRAINNVTDGWSCTIPWVVGENLDLDSYTLPFSYTEVKAFLGGSLFMSGALYKVSSSVSKGESVMELVGQSFTADLVDSSIRPPYEFRGRSFKSLAEDIVAPFGIRAIFDSGDEISDHVFRRATVSFGESAFSFLSHLASQVSRVLTSSVNGDLRITRASLSPISYHITEGESNVMEWKSSYDGRLLHSFYTAVSSATGHGHIDSVVKNEFVPRFRIKYLSKDDNVEGDLTNAAEWARTRELGKAATLNISIVGWRASSGELWGENKIVFLKSKSLRLSEGHPYLIERVRFELSTKGRVTHLTLVPPNVYTGQNIGYTWS